MISFYGKFSIYGRFLTFQSIRMYDKHNSIYVGNFHLGNSLCHSKICCFQIHFVNFHRSIQMAAFLLQTIPSFYTKSSQKSLFISANTYEKYIVCTLFVQTTASRITTTRRVFYPVVNIILYYLETLKSS